MTSFSLLVLSLCATMTLQSASGFVVAPQKTQNHHKLHMFGRGTSNEQHSVKGAAKITEINKMEDFLKFLGEDDRLCVVK